MKNEIKYVGVVQVTNWSNMFPEKCLQELNDGSVLEFLIQQLKKADFLDEIIIATTQEHFDDSIAKLAKSRGINFYRGDKRDIISRIYHAVEAYSPSGVVHVLGNSPLIDIEKMRELVEVHRKAKYDFCYNEHAKGIIYGMGCSVFSFDVLRRLYENQDLTLLQRETGSFYIRQNPEKFRIYSQKSRFNRPQYRVCVDEPRDIELIKSIIRAVPDINNESVGRFLDENLLLTEYQHQIRLSEAGVEKIFLFPEKIKTYQLSDFDVTYPLVLELSFTNRCNFSCVWCSDRDLRAKLGGELSVDAYERLLDDVSKGGTKSIVVEGGGEPTLHPYFNDMVRMTVKKGLDIGLITNGSTLIDPEIVNLFKWIRISLDAATAEQHAKFKKVKMFEKIMQNIHSIGEHKKETVLGIGYVVTKHNVDNLEDLILRLKMYNVDYIQFRPVIDHPDLSSGIDLSYLSKYAMPNFRVDIYAMSANVKIGNDHRKCKAHSLSTVVTADGGVYLCGRLNIYDWCKPIGNINQDSFHDMWLGEERKRQNEEVLDPEFCFKNCPTCRMTKYNILLDQMEHIKTKTFI
ncbi:MAG: radical SAM protein [Candidatus Omnitrophica bacterium]|nr:radical SAM protein [Candidatus Omnitrophota bacterium]